MKNNIFQYFWMILLGVLILIVLPYVLYQDSKQCKYEIVLTDGQIIEATSVNNNGELINFKTCDEFKWIRMPSRRIEEIRTLNIQR